MSEREVIDKIKERQGVFDTVQNVFTGGYGTKEDLREVDKKLRDFYYADFKALRHRWEEISLAALNAEQKSMGDDLKKVLQVIDRVAEKVHHGDYGYSGLWDRKGSIREKELARIFNFDKALDLDLQGIVKAVAELYSDSELEKWNELNTKIRNIKSLILDFESKWNEREESFRPLEM
ncbi:MAG: hypothetical protein JSW72_06260 [Candidatus Bathyarchaeota archaeon]|nr:MAG: hypothetical protein JSW72_06260 [Candidatus Bathyarchaeota archaeon]